MPATRPAFATTAASRKGLISIAHIPRRVAGLTGQVGPSPRRVYDLALRGSFPAEFVGGRWFVDEADIPAVVAALGLTIAAA